MYQKYHAISFYLSLVCLFVYSYLLYACIKNEWIITSFSTITLSLLITILLTMGLIGFAYKGTVLRRVKSWLTICILLTTQLASFIGGKEHLETVSSPDASYTVHLYTWNAGGAGTFGVVGELDGLWFNKRIYKERRTEEVRAKWRDSHTIAINHRELDLKKGDTYFKKVRS